MISVGAAEGLLLEQLSISPSVAVQHGPSHHHMREDRSFYSSHGDVCQAMLFLRSSESNILFGKFFFFFKKL